MELLACILQITIAHVVHSFRIGACAQALRRFVFTNTCERKEAEKLNQAADTTKEAPLRRTKNKKGA